MSEKPSAGADQWQGGDVGEPDRCPLGRPRYGRLRGEPTGGNPRMVDRACRGHGLSIRGSKPWHAHGPLEKFFAYNREVGVVTLLNGSQANLAQKSCSSGSGGGLQFAVCAVRDDPQTTNIEIVCDGARLLLWRKISPLSAVNSHRPAPGEVFR